MLPGGGFILLNTAVTPELAAEGLARDVVRVVQQARRAADLGVSDRISLSIAGTPVARQAMRMHEQLIANETLATAVELVGPTALDDDPQAGEAAAVGENESIRIRLTA
jgi:isoleucyl-tRNA synthetase